jgi:ParB family chromosome partitioning protein
MAKPALGRGLGALLGGQPSAAKPAAAPSTPVAPPAPAPAPAPEPANTERVLRVPLERVQPSALQPRKYFAPESLQELSDSIREQGILQPLIVRKRGEHLELIAGERRWRASEMAGLTEVPVIIRVADDATVLELMLIENLQREGLNPIEEALGYAQLATQFQLRQEDIATKVGKSRVAVANALRLLKLAADVQVYVRDGRISVGHAKVILGLNSEAEQKLAAERVIKDSLTVRQTEELIAVMQATQMAKGASSSGSTKTPATRDLHLNALENRLLEKFGTKVALKYKQGKGSVEIKFFNDDDLQRILDIVGVNMD